MVPRHTRAYSQNRRIQHQTPQGLWTKFVDLQMEFDRVDADVARIQRDMRALIAVATRVLPRSTHRPQRSMFDLRRSWIKDFYFFLGNCCARREEFSLAEVYLRRGLDRYNAHRHEGLAAFLIKRGRMKDAARVLQQTPLKVIRSEDENTAMKYLGWLMTHDELVRLVPPRTIVNWLRTLAAVSRLKKLSIQVTATKPGQRRAKRGRS